MVKHIFKFSKIFTSVLWKTIEVFFVLFVVLGALVLYNLHENPIDGKKYIPEIASVLLPQDSGYRFETESVILTSDWSRDGLIQIDVKNLKLLRSDDSVVFETPTASFSYNLWHIITFNAVPSTLILENPFLEMDINKQGDVAVKTAKSDPRIIKPKKLRSIVEKILSIQEIQVNKANLRIKDFRFDQEWELLNITLELKRHFRFIQSAKLNSTVKGEGVQSHLLAHARLNRFQRILSLEAGLDKINLQKISNFIPILKEADLLVQLSIKGQLDVSRSQKNLADYITKLQFNAKTLKPGTLNLMGDLDNLYHVQSADINGTLGTDAKILKIASSKVELVDEKPADFYLDVLGLDVFLNTGNSKELKTTLKATLYDVPTEHIPGLWPSKQGPEAHEWVNTHLSKGLLREANFTLYFTGDELTDLLGDIHATGVRVDYLPPMKAIEDVSAQVLLYPDKVHILADQGTIGKLSLEKADLLFTDLDKEQAWLQIDLQADGPANQILELIASKPLEFPQMFNLKPATISGQAKTFVHLSFPLDENLTTGDVQAIVHADVNNAKVNAPFENLGLKNGTIALDVSNDGLKISGDIWMKNSPLKIKWNEYFNPKEIKSEYELSGVLQSKDICEITPNICPFIKGKIGTELHASQSVKETYSGVLKLNADNSWVDLPFLSVQKKSTKPMALTISFSDVNKENGNAMLEVAGELKKEADLKINSEAVWTKDLTSVSFDVLAAENQFSGQYKTTLLDLSLVLKGKDWQAYDLNKLYPVFQGQGNAETVIKSLELDIDLEKFSLNSKKPFKNLKITGYRQGALWQNFHVQAKALEPFVLIYDSKKKQFQGSFSDTGDLLDRLNFSDRLIGGKLAVVADQQNDGKISGKLTVDKTELKETGFLMQAMTILGIVDAFQGEDMLFDEIEIPFVLTPDFNLTIDDAYAVGTNLGVTFKGQIDGTNLNLSGAVVPAYAINSLPGKIPLVGWLFRDSAKGGLINVPYTIEGSLFTPEISWNPLKAITPGALGRLF